jgi:hypothetical protein
MNIRACFLMTVLLPLSTKANLEADFELKISPTDYRAVENIEDELTIKEKEVENLSSMIKYLEGEIYNIKSDIKAKEAEGAFYSTADESIEFAVSEIEKIVSLANEGPFFEGQSIDELSHALKKALSVLDKEFSVVKKVLSHLQEMENTLKVFYNFQESEEVIIFRGIVETLQKALQEIKKDIDLSGQLLTLPPVPHNKKKAERLIHNSLPEISQLLNSVDSSLLAFYEQFVIGRESIVNKEKKALQAMLEETQNNLEDKKEDLIRADLGLALAGL